MCTYPVLTLLKKKGVQNVCLNPECPTKKIEDATLQKEAEQIDSGKVTKPCPKCGKGHLVLRKSLYGSFYGCSNYPKCKHTEKIEDQGEQKPKDAATTKKKTAKKK